MFDIKILENGDLEITLDAVDETESEEVKEEIQEYQEKMDDISVLLCGTESFWTNGSFQPFDAGDGNPFVGLTSAPCIAESMSYDDDANATIEGNFWYFGDYMLESFIDILLRDGRVVFTLCK